MPNLHENDVAGWPSSVADAQIAYKIKVFREYSDDE
jgi:hypothetical protein